MTQIADRGGAPPHLSSLDGGPAAPRARPWWTEPWMWLVAGGPAAVVAAGVATGVLAYSGADRPVLPDRAAHGAAPGRALEPAMKARNAASTHAAAGAAPQAAR